MAHTYTELKLEVEDWLHRTDLTTKMDTFAEFAEAQINKDLRAMEMETRLPVTFTDTFYDLPADYLEMRALHLENSGARIPIAFMTPQQLDRNYSRATGRPRAFTIQAGQIELRPGLENTGSPTVTYDGEMTYYASVPSLVTNTTNDVLIKYPLIYFTAMLYQANLYLQDDTEAQKNLGNYALQIDQANKQASGGRYITPQVRNT